jgi:hypothetical protein
VPRGPYVDADAPMPLSIDEAPLSWSPAPLFDAVATPTPTPTLAANAGLAPDADADSDAADADPSPVIWYGALPPWHWP